MAQDSDLERSEAPSQRRLDKAREDGQVARSRELSTFLVCVGTAIFFSAYGSDLVEQMRRNMRLALSISRADAFEPAAMGQRLEIFSLQALGDLTPLFVVLCVLAVLSALAIGGWMFSATAFMPNPSRLNALAGLKRMVSTRGLIELAKSIAKTVVLGALGAWLLWDARSALLRFSTSDLAGGLAIMGGLLARALFWMCAGLALIAGGDVPVQLIRHNSELKMTRQEVRDEQRDSDGNPQVRQRIRQMQRAMARRRMMAAVPKADVVVVNPTHFAVALSYSKSMRAPKVVAKGGDEIARRIRELAEEHRVPILEAPPLARALFRHTDIGQEIPAALYEAVALVMAYIFQLRRYKTQGGAYPLVPGSLPVPSELDPGVGETA
jgi:flagellar biosynthetic protein FlhB